MKSILLAFLSAVIILLTAAFIEHAFKINIPNFLVGFLCGIAYMYVLNYEKE